MSDKGFEVHPGEQVHISWFPYPSYLARYSLAYDERGAMAIGFIRDIQSVTSMISGSGQSIPTINSTHLLQSTDYTPPQTIISDRSEGVTTMAYGDDIVTEMHQSDQSAIIPITAGVMCTTVALAMIAAVI